MYHSLRQEFRRLKGFDKSVASRLSYPSSAIAIVSQDGACYNGDYKSNRDHLQIVFVFADMVIVLVMNIAGKPPRRVKFKQIFA